MKMYSSVVKICVLGLFAALPSLADDSCADWDDKVEDFVFETARDQIKKAGKARESIPDVDQSVGWHTGILTKNGMLGDLTSFKLVHFRSNGPACLMCQISNGTHSNITLAMDLGLTELAVTFDNFLLKLPFLPTVGNTATTILNSGNAVSVSVSVLTTAASNCIVNVNYFQIHDLGTFRVQFKNGFLNSLYQMLFNVSSRLIEWTLGRFGVMSRLENQISQSVYDVSSQHGPEVCQLINNIFH